MTPEQLNGWLQLGGGALMLLALVLGHRRLWVFGWVFQQMVDERDEWKRIALRSLDVAETSVSTLTPESANQAQKVIRGTRA